MSGSKYRFRRPSRLQPTNIFESSSDKFARKEDVVLRTQSRLSHPHRYVELRLILSENAVSSRILFVSFNKYREYNVKIEGEGRNVFILLLQK